MTLEHIGLAVSSYFESILDIKVIEFAFHPDRANKSTELVWIAKPLNQIVPPREYERFSAEYFGKAATSANSKFQDKSIVFTVFSRSLLNGIRPSRLFGSILLKAQEDGCISVHRVISMSGGTVTYEP